MPTLGGLGLPCCHVPDRTRLVEPVSNTARPSDPGALRGWLLSFKRPKRESNARAKQGKARNTVLGGEETPIVHATDHSFKATSVMIASAGF